MKSVIFLDILSILPFAICCSWTDLRNGFRNIQQTAPPLRAVVEILSTPKLN